MLISDRNKKILSRALPTTPQQLLRLALENTRILAVEGNVETLVSYARKRMKEADLSEESRRIIGAELDSLLVEGYANEAFTCLEEAMLICGYTQVDELVKAMYGYLDLAEIDTQAWLDENGSSQETIEALLEEGEQMRKINLNRAHEVYRKRNDVRIPVTD